MEYSQNLPPESRAAVAAEKLRAGKDFDLVREHPSSSADVEAQIRKYILRQFLAFVREASKLGNSGIWQVDHVEEAALEFLRLATIDALYDKGRGLGRGWISDRNGSLTSQIERQFEKSSEWQQYQDILLQVAEGQALRAASANVETLTDPKQRPNYRAEVDAWRERENLRTLADAARRLTIDFSALKSIRTSRGKLRCGQDTLDRVLRTIGCKGA